MPHPSWSGGRLWVLSPSSSYLPPPSASFLPTPPLPPSATGRSAPSSALRLGPCWHQWRHFHCLWLMGKEQRRAWEANNAFNYGQLFTQRFLRGSTRGGMESQGTQHAELGRLAKNTIHHIKSMLLIWNLLVLSFRFKCVNLFWFMDIEEL